MTQLPPSSTWPVTIEDPPPCDDAACARGFQLDEVFYETSCTRVAAEFVTDEAIADGPNPVHVIAGVDPLALVAQRGPSPSCDESGQAPDGPTWHMAFGPAGHDRDAVCRVGDLTFPQERSNGC